MLLKLLVYMEEVVTSSDPLEALIETDETYVIESQKGTKVTHRKPRRHGESSGKRGLSNDQLCICVATDRDHHVFARCVNRAKPGSEDIMNALGNHIAEKSVLLFDGLTSYNYLAEQKNCEKVSLIGHESYNKVYHLNTVNSLHSRFKEMMRKLRGVATKYLNRYAALFSLITMTAERSVTEAADQVRRSLRSIRLPVTIESEKTWKILAI